MKLSRSMVIYLPTILALVVSTSAMAASHKENDRTTRIDIVKSDAHLKKDQCFRIFEKGNDNEELMLQFLQQGPNECDNNLETWKKGVYRVRRVLFAQGVLANNTVAYVPVDNANKAKVVGDGHGNAGTTHSFILLVKFDEKGPYKAWISVPKHAGAERHTGENSNGEHGGSAHGVR